ncbi:TPA: hypothetical protein UL921_002352 [Stenotrophomonas maltophilia]|nr:hypothetical protein [Stenotrophomonas maltophilia]
MAIVDYATLQSSIANWLARADLANVIPDFIQLAEARINRDLRTRKMQKTIYGVSASRKITLPDDYAGMVSFKAADSSDLEVEGLLLDGDFILDGSELLDGENVLAPLAALFETFPQSPIASPPYTASSGVPISYNVIGDEIFLVGGRAACVYAMTYWAKLKPLSNTNQQNWLLTEEPGIYLYGALTEASPYMKDDERTVLWATQYRTIVDGIQRSDEQERYGNAPAMVLLGRTP